MSDDADVLNQVEQTPVQSSSNTKTEVNSMLNGKRQTSKTQKRSKPIKKKGVNTVTLIGVVERKKLKQNGSIELWLNTDQTREDTPVKGRHFPSKFTSTLLVKIPTNIAEKSTDMIVEGACLSVNGRLKGVRRVHKGQSYDLVEMDGISVSEFPEYQENGKFKGTNTATIGGLIQKIDVKKSGSVELWVNIDTSRKDTPIRGAATTSFFTSVIFARVNAKLAKRVGSEAFEAGNVVILPGYLVGVNTVINAESNDIVEFRAKDLISIGKSNSEAESESESESESE